MDALLKDVLAILGGSGLVVFFIKLVAEHISKKKLQSLVNKSKKDLESIKFRFQKELYNYSRISDVKFKQYNELWKQLVDLKLEGEDLFEEVSKENLTKFKKSLKETVRKIEQNRLILEYSDYISLKRLIKKIKYYDIGKTQLYNLNLNQRSDNPELIKNLLTNYLVSFNKTKKTEYERILDRLARSFKLTLEKTELEDIQDE